MPKSVIQKLLLLNLAKKTYANKKLINTYINPPNPFILPNVNPRDYGGDDDDYNGDVRLRKPFAIIIIVLDDSIDISDIVASAISYGFRFKYLGYYGVEVFSWNQYALYEWSRRYYDNDSVLVLSDVLNNHFRFKHYHTTKTVSQACSCCGSIKSACVCPSLFSRGLACNCQCASGISMNLCTSGTSPSLCTSGTDIRLISPKSDENASGQNNYYPSQIASIYNFPAPTTTPLCIGVIGLSGVVNSADIQQYWLLNCKIPQVNLPKIIIISTDGSSISPANVGYEQENTIDVELIGGCCASTNSNIISNVTIVLYHAENTLQGFYNAFQYAINDTVYKPSVISCSWGTPEIDYTDYGASGIQTMKAFNTLFGTAVQKGINICCATGDNAASDGVNDGKPHVDFPASSPNVVACGGTTLICPDGVYSSMTTNETVWSFNVLNNNGTGGGMSDVFQKPTYQLGVVPTNYVNRCVPDIVSNSDPSTGFYVRYNGNMYIIGGTSCASPIIASFIALSKVNKFINPIIYKNPSAFHKISIGNNGTYSANPLQPYTPCTGLGSINGKVLLPLLS
jgi:subtilase family serine protease